MTYLSVASAWSESPFCNREVLLSCMCRITWKKFAQYVIMLSGFTMQWCVQRGILTRWLRLTQVTT